MVTICTQLADAFRAECELWAIPPAQEAAWFGRLDWHLNWQMSKGLAHVPARASSELVTIARKTGLPISPPFEGDPLLLFVASHGLVQAEICLLAPGSADPAAWLKSIHQQSKKLNATSVQVFHPAEIKAAKLTATWEKLNPSLDMQLVSEELL